MQPGFPGPFFLAGNFGQAIIKVFRISEHFLQAVSRQKPRRRDHTNSQSPHQCLQPLVVVLEALNHSLCA